MTISEPQIMMDFHRHIYLIVKEATKHTHYIKYNATHLKVEKMTNKERESDLKYITYDTKILADRWLEKEAKGTTLTGIAKEALEQVSARCTNRLF